MGEARRRTSRQKVEVEMVEPGATGVPQVMPLPPRVVGEYVGMLRAVEEAQARLNSYVAGVRAMLGVPDEWRLVGTREGGLLLASPEETARLVQPAAQGETGQGAQEG